MKLSYAWAALALFGTASTTHAAKPETKAQHDARMNWWRESRFGLFIHWGLYSVPAGKWGNNTGYGEWIRESAQIPVEVYEQFRSQFNPVKFNADEWAQLAKDAGMKYVVITTKHHDGFGLFDSKYTDWCIRETPYKKDVMAQLSKAVRKKGLTMGWYHSIMDWHHPDYLPRRSWEGNIRPVDGADFERYNTYLRNQVTELLTKYGPIGVMWFDGEWESTWSNKYGVPLYDLCRNLQPNVIVNNRVSNGRGGMEDATLKVGDYSTPEQTIPGTGMPGVDWETCMTMNDHWGYNAWDRNWKPTKTLIRNLVDIASKGGNYLLNVGPRADGTFPPEAISRMKEMGQWMRVNGDSIYGTTASLFDKLPWGRTTTKRHGRNTTIYLQVFDWPKDGKLVLPGVGNRPLGAKLMAGGKRVAVEQKDASVVVSVPAKAPDAICSTIAVELAGAPVIYTTPTITAPTSILLDKLTVAVKGQNTQVRYTLDGRTPTASSPLAARPFTITGTTTVKAAAFRGDQRVSPVATRVFRKAVPMPALELHRVNMQLYRQVYAGDFEKVPDFDKLTPRESGPVRDLSVPGKPTPEEHVAQRYTGYLEAPADGLYAFELVSDDGSKLWVDGSLIVDNDGLHGAEAKQGAAPLAKGWHRIQIGWFNATGGSDLALKWGLLGKPLQKYVSPR